MKNHSKTKGWTDERREKYRVRCLNQKPWQYATGPRTDKGKSISAQNARTHGGYDATMRTLCHLLTLQSRFLDKTIDMNNRHAT